MSRRPALSRQAATWPLGAGGPASPGAKGLPRNERRSGTRPRLVVGSAGPDLVIVGPTPTPPPVEVVEAYAPPPPSSRVRPKRRLGRAMAAGVLLFAALLWIGARALEGTPLRAVGTWSSALRMPDAIARRALGAVGHATPSAFSALEPATDPMQIALPEMPWRPLKHEGHSSVPGGVVFAPRSFTKREGTYDLLVHFHGNTQVVRESAEVAGLDAIVVVINLGIGSAPYEEAYAVPGTWEKLLESIQRAVRERGVASPKLGRVALSGWSAGYGAISTILQVRRGHEDLDAILSLDGIHCGFEGGGLNPRQLAPFAAAAKRAAAGELLFSITHSAIDPRAYASTTATADYLLAAVGGHRGAPDEAPAYLSLESMKGAVAKDREKKMEPTGSAHVGELVVRGFKGEEPEHHMAHLFQMAATVLPDLTARWR